MMYLADTVAAEQAEVEAGAAACGHTCECHGNYVCVRTSHPEGMPHVGFQEDGSLVQWASGQCLTAEQVAEGRQAAAGGHL